MKKIACLLFAVLLVACNTADAASSTSAENQEVSTSVQSFPENRVPETEALPDGFVYVTDVIEDVLLEMRYYSSYNFVGARVDDYERPVAILTTEAAEALQGVAEDLAAQGYILKIFDAYRPTGAVEHFTRWAEDAEDSKTKEYFYPDIDKSRLFAEGYLATYSGHSRGSTVDLTLVDKRTGKEVDMGGPFDFFGPISHFGTGLIAAEQAAGREILKEAMVAGGFDYYDNEWWHYVLVNEPYPDTYFDFPVA